MVSRCVWCSGYGGGAARSGRVCKPDRGSRRRQYWTSAHRGLWRRVSQIRTNHSPECTSSADGL